MGLRASLRETRPERLGWCASFSGYASEEYGCNDADDHDHYDLAVAEETGEVLYRLDPIGTTYLLADGSTVRLRYYDDDPFIDPPLDDKIIPRYDYVSPDGGAAGGVTLTQIGALWDGAVLAPGVRRTVTVAPERPAPGSLYVRPNGEAWRLRGYSLDWKSIGKPGRRMVPSWSIANVDGSQSHGGTDTLPDDAVLVWAP